MAEQYRSYQDIEGKLGINLVKPSEALVNNLTGNLARVAHQLNTSPLYPRIPQAGVLEQPLSLTQLQGVSQLLEEEYAQSAVELQDRLTAIPLHESGEVMVSIPLLFEENGVPLSLSTLPFHEACGDWAGKQRVFWARKQVAESLVRCGGALDSIGLVLHIEDAFRPVGVQEGLFLRRAKMILQQHPEWVDSLENVWKEARSKTAISPLMAGHKSGAALDMTLRRKSDGQPLPLGNKYPEGGAKVALHYPYVTEDEWATRQLFSLTMEMGGLRMYPYESWHASAGDLSAGIAQFSASQLTPDYQANYGPIESFDEKTGIIQAYPSDKLSQPFFDREELLQLVARDI